MPWGEMPLTILKEFEVSRPGACALERFAVFNQAEQEAIAACLEHAAIHEAYERPVIEKALADYWRGIG